MIIRTEVLVRLRARRVSVLVWTSLLVTLAAVAVAGSLAAVAWAEETSGRTLEDVAP